MRTIATLMTCLAAVASAPAYARDAAVEAPIVEFAEAFDKGDIPGAIATMAHTVAITDELAPYHWEGADAFKHWGADFEIDAKAKGIAGRGLVAGRSR